MRDRARETGDRVARQQALADIQARLEMVEDDLQAIAAGEVESRSRRATGDDLYAQAEDIERLLEDLMGEDVGGNLGGRDPESRGISRAILPAHASAEDMEWTDDLDAMYREEEEAAGELADTIERHRRPRAARRRNTAA